MIVHLAIGVLAMTDSDRLGMLLVEFNHLDVHDDRKLIDWLNRLFTTAREQSQAIPHRDNVASRIGMARMMLPHPQLSRVFIGEPSEETEWVITWCLTALITYPPVEGLNALYAHCADITRKWLSAHP